MTNTLKHAGRDRARRADPLPGAASVEVDVDRRRPAPTRPRRRPRGGLGLIGMRERVAAHDGALEAGPRAGGGFRVRARFPLPQPARPR